MRRERERCVNSVCVRVGVGVWWWVWMERHVMGDVNVEIYLFMLFLIVDFLIIEIHLKYFHFSVRSVFFYFRFWCHAFDAHYSFFFSSGSFVISSYIGVGWFSLKSEIIFVCCRCCCCCYCCLQTYHHQHGISLYYRKHLSQNRQPFFFVRFFFFRIIVNDACEISIFITNQNKKWTLKNNPRTTA